MPDFLLPDVGEGLTEAEIVTWRVAVGDEVVVNDVLVDIETAKSVVELPSPFSGRVTELLADEGESVEVGTPIVRIEASETEAETGAESQGSGVLVGYGPAAEEQRGLRRRRRRPVAPAAQVSGDSAALLAKPPVRRFAKDHGVDLADIAPADPSGIITRADVEAHLSSSDSDEASASPESGLHEQRVPIAGVRKRTAEAMVESAFTAPHVTEWVTVEVGATMRLVERLRQDPAFASVHVTPTSIAAKAVCLALGRTPDPHARLDQEAGEIVFGEHVHLGVATATERGLLVPVIERAESLSLRELATQIEQLSAGARAGTLGPEQLTGGTFTITNIGVFGVDAGTPILYPGQSGILALGAVSRRPWVDESTDEIVPAWVVTLACSFDHRVVDGEQGSRFLADVAAILHDPARALEF